MGFMDRFSALMGGARAPTRARPTAAYMRNERHALFENWYPILRDPREDVRADYLERLGSASESAHWVCAADKVHNAGSILADLRRTIDADTVWGRFNGGRAGTMEWYRGVHDRLVELGFAAPIMAELRALVEQLEAA